MEYGRLVVLGYSSYRVASGTKSMSSGDGDNVSSMARSPQGRIGAPPRRSEKDRRTIGQLWEPIGDQNAQYVLTKRKRGNGVKLSRFHHFFDAALRDPEAPASKVDLKVVTRRMMHAIEIRNKAEQRAVVTAREGSSEEDAEEVVSPSSSGSASSVSSAKPPPPSSFLMCVPMNDTDAHASVTEYVEDETTDMFQIGRMPCRQNDVVIPGPRVGASGTISRFAARILCSREAPYECRIYAGGFDVGRKMTTAGHTLKRCSTCSEWLKRVPADHKCIQEMLEDTHGNNQLENNEPSIKETQDKLEGTSGADLEHAEQELTDPESVPIDGLTKNGVRIWLPEQKQWFEVSVNGNLYAIAQRTPSQSSTSGRNAALNPDTSVRHSAFNRPTAGIANVSAVLTDGAIIDLGGVQLQFQASRRSQNPDDPAHLRQSIIQSDDVDQQTDEANDSSVASKMEKLNVHCPVQLHQLRFDRGSSEEDIEMDQVPHVFPACGHVFGYEERIARSKVCPLCRKPGNLVRLLLKENFQLMSRAERRAVPECVFNPCGHAISNKLATHYSSLLMPNGRSICPFCAVHLDSRTPFSRLYLYSENDTESPNIQL